MNYHQLVSDGKGPVSFLILSVWGYRKGSAWIIFVGALVHDQLFLIGSLGIFIGKILSGVLTMMVNALLLNRYMEAK
ncbi:hypothetical protein JIR001_31200 [Polycladomyces abyssicola]|uniref:Uncharacterized protein n=1 Tax=Polycladomyces abyssicola TaxID=1125966 RepID=A0A8D5UH52_9BACL|nr:hypothetical protein [Polycladomyces abyssicola]BCU83337.1 hypothetical protein JIR001_31200 [Polycladomyces abyssicola]